MLIRGAEIEGERLGDLRIADGRIAEIGERLRPRPGEPVVEGAGGALFPGLHDHHIHLAAYAASLDSVSCGPPEIRTAEDLAARLSALDGPEDWLRGTGYHDAVAGPIERIWLDRVIPARPVRIQHRSGRLWIFNSAALDRLKPAPGDPLERDGGRLTGRLYDADDWLRDRLGGRFPSLARASRNLARWGVTGVTDTTASNGPAALAQIRAQQEEGALLQSVLVMGDETLDDLDDPLIGARKFHLHDTALPDFDETIEAIRRSHDRGRAAAFHCVTRVDLTFALAALEAAGAGPRDRIEHASIAPPDLLPQMRDLGVTVVTQPSFIVERGDGYLAELPEGDLLWLYRASGLVNAAIPIAGGTDAPFGAADPWALMHAAMHRRTRLGALIGPGETLSAEDALGLFLGTPENPGSKRRVTASTPADIVLIDRPWHAARNDLSRVRVRAALRAGTLIFSE